MDIKGQMRFYQHSNRANKCGEVLFDLTDSLCMEHVKNSGCDSYDNSKSYRKRRSIFNKKYKDKCEVGPWGTKLLVVKIGYLAWDCGDKDRFKCQYCDGVYLVIEGQSKWGKRAIIMLSATINIDSNQNGEAPPALPAATFIYLCRYHLLQRQPQPDKWIHYIFFIILFFSMNECLRT
ncbi:hypothetical protein F8M41_025943 [Gigaspora margarita]|uniref:Uncharacterized protein n=1 Tax=Gigaspora margarita TaxID=4874 RepID=A0A8H4AZV3_GIGMA|nr:hypothetical protein F8M41_025943 [Gigaspora margarita]